MGVVALVALAATGCGTGDGATGRSYSSAEARRVVIDLVEETLRATTSGLDVRDVDDARVPDECSPPGVSHSWVYGKEIVVRGERARKLVDDIAAFWRSKGYEVKASSEPRAHITFDGFNFSIRTTGPNGENGMNLGGSSPCLPGPGSPVG